MPAADDVAEVARRRVLALLECDGPRLHALLFRITRDAAAADDLLQELALRLLRRLQEGDPPADLAAYATRTAANLALEHLRREKRRGRLTRESAAAVAGDGPAARAAERDLLDRVLLLAADLPEQTRDAFLLHHVAGEPYAAVAAKLNKTPQQVRGLCHHAIRLLRNRLAD